MKSEIFESVRNDKAEASVTTLKSLIAKPKKTLSLADMDAAISPIVEYADKIVVKGDLFADDSSLWENA